LAEFIDYLIEATVLIGEDRAITKLELTEVLEAYGDYLRLGVNATNKIASTVASVLRPGNNKVTSVTPKMAAVRRFLHLSEDVRKEMAELARIRGTITEVANQPLLPNIGNKRPLQPSEVRAMQAHSMLAGVLAGGPKLLRAVVLKEDSADVVYDEQRAFPYDKTMDLICSMPTYRDKAFYSFLAASGSRAHEGLQLLSEDVDVHDGRVRLVDPASRPGHWSYRSLTTYERDALAWKGRTSDVTLLIEPFATAFFESLHKYLELEHIAHGRHNFLFQYLKGTQRGIPYFLSAPGTRLELFHRMCKRVGVSLPKGTGAHSLRHTYGTYLLNYFPRASGDFGLPAPMVQQLMGHADIKSTLKYARFDRDLLKLETQSANQFIFQRGVPKTLLELKLAALEAQIANVKSTMQQGA
jgi:integrase/recombinase XerD